MSVKTWKQKRGWQVKSSQHTTPIPSNAKMAVPKNKGSCVHSAICGLAPTDGKSWNT